jgi:hypothetical protein
VKGATSGFRPGTVPSSASCSRNPKLRDVSVGRFSPGEIAQCCRVRPPHPARARADPRRDSTAATWWATRLPAKLPEPRAAGTPKAGCGDVVINYAQTVVASSFLPRTHMHAHSCTGVRARPLLRTHAHVHTSQGRVSEDASARHRGTHAPQAPYFAVFFPLAAEALRARMKEGGNEIFIAHHVLCGCLRVCSSSVGTPTSTAISTPGTKPHSGTPQNARKDRDVTSAEFDAEARRVGEKQEGEK